MDYVTSLNGMFKNQNITLLALATNKGYRVYESYNFLQVSEDDDYQELIGPLKIVQVLYESNVVVFVGTAENTNFPESQVILWDDIKKRKIGVLMMNEAVLDFKLSKTAIFVLLKNKIVVFELLDLKYVFTIQNVVSYPKLIALSCTDDLTVLCYFNSSKLGEIKVLKLSSSKEGSIKHKFETTISSELRLIERITISKKGDLIALVSKGGTIVHVYSTTQYQLIYCIWRGKNEEEILDVTFSKKNKFLCVVNSKNTINIYALDPSDQHIVGCHCKEVEEVDKTEHQTGLFSSMFSKVKSIFSSVKPINSYAKYKLMNEDPYAINSIYEDRTNTVMIFFDKVNELIVVSSKGVIEKIKFNTKEGGYCWNYKTINWLSPQKRDGLNTFD